MNEVWLAGISGAILATLLALQVSLGLLLASPSDQDSNSSLGGPLATAWAACFFIYAAYALLPIRLRHACIAGVLFSVAHFVSVLLLFQHEYPAFVAQVSPKPFFLFYILLNFQRRRLVRIFTASGVLLKVIFMYSYCLRYLLVL